jgi:hypothetical protein
MLSRIWKPVILHIGFGFRRRADSEFSGYKSVLLVERTGNEVDLQRIKPNVLRRN